MKLSFRSHGSGPKVLFLHGYAGSVLHWEEVVAQLQSEFTCVVLNYSHFYLGRQSISFSEQVDVLATWISRQFPDEKIHVVGMSYGASLAWALNAKYSNLIDQAVYLNPMPPAPIPHFGMSGMKFFFKIPVSRKLMIFFLTTFVGRRFLTNCARVFRLHSDEHAKRISQLKGKKILLVGHLLNNFAWILKSENWKTWENALMKNRKECLLIFDDQDPLFRKPAYSEFNELIRATEKLVIRGAGHIATSGLPILIAQNVGRFLNRKKSLPIPEQNRAA